VNDRKTSEKLVDYEFGQPCMAGMHFLLLEVDELPSCYRPTGI
jgi:hypothetical protein